MASNFVFLHSFRGEDLKNILIIFTVPRALKGDEMRKKEIVGLGSFQFMAMTRRGLFYGFLTLYMLEVLKRSFTEAISAMALPMLANSLTQTFVWGPLSDKFKVRRLLIVIGETIAGIAYIFLSPTVWSLYTGLAPTQAKTLYAITIIVGLTLLESFWSMSNVGWSALIADMTKSTERGTIMGQLNSIGAVGRIIGVFVGGLLYDFPSKAQGFPLLFYISSAIMFASAVTLLITVEEPKLILSREDKITKTSEGEFLFKYLFYWFLVSFFFIFASLASVMQLLSYYVRIALLATSFDISLIRNAVSISNLAASPILGTLSDKKGKKPILLAGCILSVFVPILYTLPRSIFEMVLVSAVAGIARAIFSTVSYAFVAELIPENQRGKYFGQYNMVSTLSFGVAPIIISGFFTDQLTKIFLTKNYVLEQAQILAIINTFYLTAFLAGLGCLIFWEKLENTRNK